MALKKTKQTGDWIYKEVHGYKDMYSDFEIVQALLFI